MLDEDWDDNAYPVGATAPSTCQQQVYRDNNNQRSNGWGRNRNYHEGGGGGVSRQDYRGGGGGGRRGRGAGGRQDYNGGRQQPQRDFYSESNGNNASDVLYVDSYDIPKIIGRGGSTIKDIENSFRVRVNISKVIDADGNKEVKISARDDMNVTLAKEKILSIVGGDQKPAKSASAVTTTAKPYTPAPFKPIDWSNLEAKTLEYHMEKFGHLPPVQKQFYTVHEEVAQFTDAEVDAIRKRNNDIKVTRNFCEDVTRDIPKPVTKFEHCFQDYPDILAQFQSMGYKEPTPIQSQGWPVLLAGNDMIGIAQTGTGKTMAFIVPAMIHTENQTLPRAERTGPSVCILAPTRELALQIKMEVAKFQFRGMRAVCIYGGGSRKEQIDLVEKGVEIVIATPGRLNDLIENNLIDLTNVTYFVLDEADRMLDMGFEPQIQRVLVNVRPDRQTVMTSATWPAGVRRLAQQYMQQPIQVVVGTLDLAAVNSVTQHIEFVKETEKFEYILDYIRNMGPDQKLIIFCGKKLRVDDLSSELGLMGMDVSCIHGQKDQRDREQALVDIKTGVTKVLIATDVASRGIDIEDITHVINYDFPKNIEEYVHRVGRTGRAGRTGTAISYFNYGDRGNANELIKILTEAKQEVPEFLYRFAATFDDDY